MLSLINETASNRKIRKEIKSTWTLQQREQTCHQTGVDMDSRSHNGPPAQFKRSSVTDVQ